MSGVEHALNVVLHPVLIVLADPPAADLALLVLLPWRIAERILQRRVLLIGDRHRLGRWLRRRRGRLAAKGGPGNQQATGDRCRPMSANLSAFCLHPSAFNYGFSPANSTE